MSIKQCIKLIILVLSSSAYSSDIFFVGHSLVNFNMPRMLEGVAIGAGKTHSSSVQVINGSSLKYNWDNSSTAQGVDSRAILPLGQHDVMVMTEAVPIKNHVTWSDSNVYASNFYNLAISGDSATKVYLYETWPCVNSGESAGCSYDNDDHIAWRERLDSELSMWEGIADAVNSQASAAQVNIIPGGQAMARMYDEIALGRVPGISDIKDLFVDDIHLNDIGWYFIALVQYAVIYGEELQTVTRALFDEWGQPYQVPSEALALKMQEIAWQSVCNYSRSGVSCEEPEVSSVAPEPPNIVSLEVNIF